MFNPYQMSDLKRILYGSHVCVTSRYQAKVRFSSWEGVNVGIGANIGNRSIFFNRFGDSIGE